MSSPSVSLTRSVATLSRIWRIGRFFGAPIFVTPSWLLGAVVLILAYAPVAQREGMQGGVAGSYVVAVAVVVLLFASVLAHEMGHAFVARRMGVGVRAMTLWLLGGYTEMTSQPRNPRADLAISLAGPCVSFTLGISAAMVVALLKPETVGGQLAGQLALSNLVIALFNMLPGLPLDGGVALRALVWRGSGDRHQGTVVAGQIGRVIAVLILGIGLATGLHSDSGLGLAMLFGAIGFSTFFWFTASQAVHAGRKAHHAQALTLNTVMRRPLVVAEHMSLARAFERWAETSADVIVTADSNGKPTGLMSIQAALAVPAARRWQVPVRAVAHTLPPVSTLDVGLSGEALLQAVERSGAAEMVVLDGDQIVGVLAADDIMRSL